MRIDDIDLEALSVVVKTFCAHRHRCDPQGLSVVPLVIIFNIQLVCDYS